MIIITCHNWGLIFYGVAFRLCCGSRSIPVPVVVVALELMDLVLACWLVCKRNLALLL